MSGQENFPTFERDTYMKYKQTASAFAVLSLVLAMPAYAELSGEAALTSDYIWRGVSQTNEKPALQADIMYEHDSGIYTGAFASNVDFDEDVDDPAKIEVDVYIGVYGETDSGIGWDISVQRYIYPRTTESLDYNELFVLFSYSSAELEVGYTNDYFASGEDGFYYRAGFSHEFPELFTLGASLGFTDVDTRVFGDAEPDSYIDWRIGASREFSGINLDLSYYDTNSNGTVLFGKLADARLVLTASVSF